MNASYPHCRDRELAHREANGIEVVLLWNSVADRVRICVSDEHSGAYFEFQPNPWHALDAFYHPYPYAALSGVPYAGELAHASH
jgi:hypothetical protein